MAFGVMWAPGYRGSKVLTLSDTADVDPGGCVGLHNAHTSGGLVKVTYANGMVDTIYLSAGVFLSAHVTRVWSTGTDVALAAKIHALYA